VRSTESTALHVLRAIEEEGIRNRSTALNIAVPTAVALYILNNKRSALAELEQRHNLRLTLGGDDSLIPPDYRMERSKVPVLAADVRAPVSQPDAFVEDDEIAEEEDETSAPEAEVQESEGGRRRSRRRRRRRDDGRPRRPGEAPARVAQPEPEVGGNGEELDAEVSRIDGGAEAPADDAAAEAQPASESQGQDGDMSRRRRRRGRRGGRRRRRGGERPATGVAGEDERHVAAAPVEPDEYTGGPITDWTEEEDTASDASGPAELPAEPSFEFPARDEGEFHVSPDGPLQPQDNGRHGGSIEPYATVVDEPAEQSADPATASPAASETNGSGASPDAGEAAPEPEAEQHRPAGPPRRGWWKRLIE
jgi:ribonuclease E